MRDEEALAALVRVAAEVTTDSPLPACLAGHSGALPLHCKVCSAMMESMGELVRHGEEHTKGGGAVCSYCGQACPSLVSLRLHQMSWPAPPSPRSLLTCPLACGAPGLTAASLPTHLVTFHGAEEGSEERVVAGKSMGPGVVRCPECSTELRVDLITHRLLHCYSRSPVVKARVAELVALAEEQGVTPLVMVSQEVEATLSHLSRLSSPAYREEWERGGREAARRYPGVAAALLQELAWVPPGVESGSGLLPGFQLWESVVERLEAAGGLEATNARLEKELGAAWMALGEDTVLTTDQPDVAVVEQLQAELGWARGGREAAPQGLEAVMERLQAQLA